MSKTGRAAATSKSMLLDDVPHAKSAELHNLTSDLLRLEGEIALVDKKRDLQSRLADPKIMWMPPRTAEMREVAASKLVKLERQLSDLKLSAADIRRQLAEGNAAVIAELEPQRLETERRLAAARDELYAALDDYNSISASMKEAGRAHETMLPTSIPQLDLILRNVVRPESVR